MAHEGIGFVTSASGAAAECLEKLGGLSLDQLRWMFSNYTTEELKDDDWDESSVPFLDGNETTHLWSELHEDCAAEEIDISGSIESGMSASDFFTDVIFAGRDETFDLFRPFGYFTSSQVEELISYVEANEAAITFMQLSSLLSIDRKDLVAVAVSKKGSDFVKPISAAFEDDSYPLSRRLYLALLDDEASLVNTRPFVEFGFSKQGQDILKSAGFWPIHDWEAVIMATRAQIMKGVARQHIQESCGPVDGGISLAGSSTVFPVARLWSEIYKIGCPDVNIELDGGGSSAGAGRVCANDEKGTPVDVGNMSREWKGSEGNENKNGFLYNCIAGDPTRSAIQLDVAIDGLTVATQVGGAAEECIKNLGGLTVDQLRWMFTDYTDLELTETGWDPQCLKNSDNDSRTHLWSELDPRCPRIEIRIAGPDDQSGTYEFFKETILTDHNNGETFDQNRPVFGYYNSEDDDRLVAYLRQYGEAISFFGYSYYWDNTASLAAVPIQNDAGKFVSPSDETVGDGIYNPLARRIYMNLLNDKEALRDSIPLVQFGLTQPSLVARTGYVPLSKSRTEEMLERLQNAPYGSSEEDDGYGLGMTLGIAAAIIVLVCTVLTVAVLYKKHRAVEEFSKSIPEAVSRKQSRDVTKIRSNHHRHQPTQQQQQQQHSHHEDSNATPSHSHSSKKRHHHSKYVVASPPPPMK